MMLLWQWLMGGEGSGGVTEVLKWNLGVERELIGVDVEAAGGAPKEPGLLHSVTLRA